MSQRNPMNERYQSEDHQGKTRKSAASAKPKSKAAASVVVQTSSKTPQQKKADAKAARRGLFGSGFRLSNREKAKEEKAAAKAAKAAKAAETAETPKADAK